MRGLPATLRALIFVSGYRVVAAASAIDFSFYPLKAQDCLYRASNSSNCATDTVAAANACLCFNGGNFVTNTAGCLGRTDPGDIETVYSTMKTACSDSKTPLGVSKEQYLTAAAGASASTTQSTTMATGITSSPTTTNGGQQDGERKGLSTGAKAGIIAGSSVAGIALLAGLVFFFLRKRRRRDGEESHPMLPQDHGPLIHSMLPPHHGEAGNNVAWVHDAKWRPTLAPGDGHNARFEWESPYDLSYPKAPPLTPTPPLPPHTRSPPAHEHPQVYELVGSDRQPTEMPGSVMFEVEGSPVPRQGEWRYHAATFDAADTSYPSQVARRPSR